jgi:hypothetical protein
VLTSSDGTTAREVVMPESPENDSRGDEMTDNQRSPQWGDDPANITRQDLLSTAIGVFVIGCVVGWALFGQPAQLGAFLQAGSIAEWIAALGTLIVGFGAWKYARATHFHTLDRADLESIRGIDSEIQSLLATRHKIFRLTYGRSTLEALKLTKNVTQGMVRIGLENARGEVTSLSWGDGISMAFNNEATIQFATLQVKANVLKMMFDGILPTFPTGLEALLSEDQRNALSSIEVMSKELAQVASDTISMLMERVDELAEEKLELIDKRSKRVHIFNFDP